MRAWQTTDRSQRASNSPSLFANVPKHRNRIATRVKRDSGSESIRRRVVASRRGFMTVIIVSFAFGSVVLGVLLGKLLKRAASVGTVALPTQCSVRQLERYDDLQVAGATGAGRTRLIPNSNET